MIAYARPQLAAELVQALSGQQAFSDAHNGLFLAAPRRTGKTTFLQNDLRPALEQAGIVVVYVDLWADTRRDPGTLIAEAIGRALQPQLGIVAQTAKRTGLDKINLAGFHIDTSKIGQIDGLTLVDALRVLQQAAAKPLALIIDEAQHALTSEAGEAAMVALKSARDQLNQGQQINLMLVMSGSDRDKLLRLVNSNAAPFYGSKIQRMPALGPDFIQYIAQLIEAQRPELKPINCALLHEAFKLFGERPQFFMQALGQVLSPLAGTSERFETAMLSAAQQRQAVDQANMEADYLGLKPLEQAVLWRMLEQGKDFRAYDAQALRFYQEKTGKKVSAAQAQNALESLRARSPAVVWKSVRGEYAVEDAAMHRWFTECQAAHTWPPQVRQSALDLPHHANRLN